MGLGFKIIVTGIVIVSGFVIEVHQFCLRRKQILLFI
jgi:hypothetical protein